MLWMILWALIFFTLSFVRASASIWLISLFIIFLLTVKYLEFGTVSILLYSISILLFLLFIPFFRRSLIGFLLKKFRKLLPKVSSTEQEAINAGDSGWEKNILSGNPKWKKLHKIEKPELTEKEKLFIDGPVKKLMSMIDDWKITFEDAEIPDNIWNFLKKEGFFGMIIAREYGGMEFSPYGISRIFSTLYAKSVIVATTVSVPNSLGPGELLMHYGTDEQKKYYFWEFLK